MPKGAINIEGKVMPTGYTADIDKDISFEQFAMLAAHDAAPGEAANAIAEVA